MRSIWKWKTFVRCIMLFFSLNIFHVQYRYGNSIVYIAYMRLRLLFEYNVSLLKFLLIFFSIFFSGFKSIENQWMRQECNLQSALCYYILYNVYYYVYTYLYRLQLYIRYSRNLLKCNFFVPTKIFYFGLKQKYWLSEWVRRSYIDEKDIEKSLHIAIYVSKMNWILYYSDSIAIWYLCKQGHTELTFNCRGKKMRFQFRKPMYWIYIWFCDKKKPCA